MALWRNSRQRSVLRLANVEQCGLLRAYKPRQQKPHKTGEKIEERTIHKTLILNKLIAKADATLDENKGINI